MNESTALVPAALAVSGGTALIGGIYLHEQRRDRAMRASRQAYSLVFPSAADPAAAVAALRSLAGVSWAFELVAEVAADSDGIHHVLHIPRGIASSVVDHLTASVPGLRIDPLEASQAGPVTLAMRIVVPVRALMRTEDPAAASRALLTGLSALHDGERVNLRWALRGHLKAAERLQVLGCQS